ncbi:hypothetical protein D083_0952 [Dickeya solani RNS 08.23.3.1.A]|nr:hypothetical protein D083_0952 [Dickeya solani RNS 08.23.3.1.A]
MHSVISLVKFIIYDFSFWLYRKLCFFVSFKKSYKSNN